MFRSRLIPGLIAAAALVALAGAAQQHMAPRDDPPPPAPELRVPEGRVLLESDFRATGSLAHWSPDKRGVWSLAHGALKAELPDKKQARSLIYAGSEDWSQYAVDLDVCQTRGVDKGVAVHVLGGRGVAVDLRGPGYHDVLLHLQEVPAGHAAVHNDNFVWHHMRVESLDSRFRVFIDGRLVLAEVDKRGSFPRGRIALAAYTGGAGRCTVYYDNVVVTALR